MRNMTGVIYLYRIVYSIELKTFDEQREALREAKSQMRDAFGLHEVFDGYIYTTALVQ